MLQIGVNSEPPLIEVNKLLPIPEIICSVNEDKDKIRDNIKNNIKRGLPQVRPYETPAFLTNEQPLMQL